eukprot:Skav213921  [mRNA]  locus=scaffold1439:293412:301318:- [translate_table: standard]
MLTGSQRHHTEGAMAEEVGRRAERHNTTRFVKGTNVKKPSNFEGTGLIAIFKHPLSVFMLCVPFGIWSYYARWNAAYTFWLNFFAMLPMAKILGDITEESGDSNELAAGLRNDLLAGLINATFGNAVEMVITVQTLRGGLYAVVKATLLGMALRGSVLSNVLLVLGMSFLFGGLAPYINSEKICKLSMNRLRKDQLSMRISEQIIFRLAEVWTGDAHAHISYLQAKVNTSMLLLSCLSFTLAGRTQRVTVFGTMMAGQYEMDSESLEEVMLPVTCSIIIISAYGAYIVFQLFTHRTVESSGRHSHSCHRRTSLIFFVSRQVLLFVMTAVVAFCSDLLVDSIESMTADAHMGEHFIGIILLPIVGNACEHAAAVRFAMQDTAWPLTFFSSDFSQCRKAESRSLYSVLLGFYSLHSLYCMFFIHFDSTSVLSWNFCALQDKPGLSIGIAVGSSTWQIALFVVPFAVLVGWCIDRPMDLNFGALNVTVPRGGENRHFHTNKKHKVEQ